MINTVVITGRLGQDPELRYLQSGTAVASLNLAVDDFRKAQDGSSEKITNWFRCNFWGKTAEILNQYARKGKKITVSGSLVQRTWKDRDGNDRTSVEIRVINLDLGEKMNGEAHPNGGNGQSSTNTRQAPPPPNEGILDDDIPF